MTDVLSCYGGRPVRCGVMRYLQTQRIGSPARQSHRAAVSLPTEPHQHGVQRMTAQSKQPGDTPDARRAAFRALMQRRIAEWWAEHDDPHEALSEVEHKLDAIQRVDVNLKIARYVAVAEALKLLDAELMQAALRAGAEPDTDSAVVAETIALVAAINAGMQLGAFIDSDSAESWLEGHQAARERHSGGS